MAKTWKHPRLGVFEHDGIAWSRTIRVVPFKSFSYDTGYRNARRSTGTVELSFDAHDDGDDPPPTSAVAMAEKVLANAAALVPKVTAALWEEFNGRGPVSGLWWRGDLRTVAEQMQDSNLPPPTKADDILAVMRLYRIAVHTKDRHNYDRTMVELSFHAAFEDEHGVGVLTDGNEILGTGYSTDVQPYRSPRKQPARRRTARIQRSTR